MDKYILPSFLGFVIGDALGVPVEFLSRKELENNMVTTMVGYGSHPVEAGTWSDDTSMTLATMKAIIDSKGINYQTMMTHFLNWADFGEYTADGIVFDMGITTKNALLQYKRTACIPYQAGLQAEFNNGNGSLMRMLPIAFYCYFHQTSEEDLLDIVNKSSALTHAHEISKLGCFLYVKFVGFLLAGDSKERAYTKLTQVNVSTYKKETTVVYKRILKGSLQELTVDEIQSTGYVVHTLEASLWVFLHTNTFKQALIGAVNLGEDTDTIGAITGSLAGIIYGINEIPWEWEQAIRNKNYLLELIDQFNKSL